MLDAATRHKRTIAKLGNTVASVDLPTITKLCHKRKASMVSSGDAEQLAFADGIFDLVLASEVVEHLWNHMLSSKRPTGFSKVKDGLSSKRRRQGQPEIRCTQELVHRDVVKQIVSRRIRRKTVKRLELNWSTNKHNYPTNAKTPSMHCKGTKRKVLR